MPRRPRLDAPGRRHHLLNRGQDRRAIFKRPEDYRFFLCLLALAARAGRIRIYSYCLMPNHFHLFVESLDGNISATMRWIQGRYAAFFNRVHQHSGHVLQGRFHSFPVSSERYCFVLIRYIERNPVVAGIADDILEWDWSSARWHAVSSPRPRWLDKEVVGSYLVGAIQAGHDREDAFRLTFAARGPVDRARKLVKARVVSRSRGEDLLDFLCDATPAEWVAWFQKLDATGSEETRRVPMVDARTILETLATYQARDPGACVRLPDGKVRSLWPLATVGLLRELGGLSGCVTARLLRLGESTAGRRYRAHRMVIRTREPYCEVIAEIGRRALLRLFSETPAE